MDLSENTSSISIPNELLDKVTNARANLLPEKSSGRYLKEYQIFCDWRKRNHIIGVDERVMLAYFEDNYKSARSLWSYYSMIRSCLQIYEKVDIKRYGELQQYLKRKTANNTPKKSKVLSHEQVIKFLKEANDDDYLLMKVILIVGIFGGCRREELINLTIEDVKDCGNFIKVSLPRTKTGISRSFVIIEEAEGCQFCALIRKYMSLRPPKITNKRFLLGYRNKKCVAQVVGVHTVGNVPRKIAEYLGIPEAEKFTGHCFRRSSASLLVEGGGDLNNLMTHGGWKSASVARAYIEESTRLKTNIAKKIVSSSEVNESRDESNANIELSSNNSLATPSAAHVNVTTNNGEQFIESSSRTCFDNINNCTFNFYVSNNK